MYEQFQFLSFCASYDFIASFQQHPSDDNNILMQFKSL